MAGPTWGLLNWQQVRDAAADDPVVLVPAGTVETQGPWLYVGAEYILPERLALEAARELNVLIAPTLPFGWSPDFEDYPGTISLRPEVLTEVYYDTARSIVRHGFDHVMFLVTHIPNQPSIEQAAYRLRRELGVQVAWMNPGVMAAEVMKDLVVDYPIGRGHGADPSLSIGAYLQPDAVSLPADRPNQSNGRFSKLPYLLPALLQEQSEEDGGFGDPTHASVARGELLFRELSRRVNDAIRQYGQLPSPRRSEN